MDFSTTERGLQSLQRRAPKLSAQVISIATTLLTSRFSDPAFLKCTKELLEIGSSGESEEHANPRWEPLAVGFHLTSSYLQHATALYRNDASNISDIYMEGPRVPTVDPIVKTKVEEKAQDTPEDLIVESDIVPFCEFIMTMCQRHLEHNEPRVRTLVAKVVGQHAKLGTTLQSQNEMGASIIAQSVSLYNTVLISLYDHLDSGRDTENKSKSSEGALDDTTGWRALETNLYGIGSFIQASGARYFEFSGHRNENCISGGGVDEKLLKSVEYCCVTHVNRHVRAAGINVLEQMIHACTASFHNLDEESRAKMDGRGAMDMLLLPDSRLRQTIVEVLKTALADNWSQVRMAGSVLCRVFFVAILHYAEQFPEKMEDREVWLTPVYPILLPRMCLNRFYLAQGVKLYSHETWKILFDRSKGCAGTGIESVAINAGAICRYYVKMADADNHVVREAACQAIAELANKIGRSEEHSDYLTPYVITLLQALLMCFHDESWPVRDEACLACGTFCLAYPTECEPELPTLFSRWTEQLTDQIWSVREDAAVALGDAIEAYGNSMFDQVMDILKRDLPSAKLQPAMSREEYKRRQNDIDSHTDSQLYSCGSLAPKLRKGGAGRIGCSDCLITREKAPWEATDGCIYLIRELCSKLSTASSSGLVLSDDVLLPIMTELVDSCRVKHFPQSDDLRTTLWKQLPIIGKALGKQRFKRIYLQMFLDMLSDNLDSKSHASQLSVHAAGQCAEELANLVGHGIFRGRLEEDWQKDNFDRVMEDRRHMARSTLPEGFSPFGPAEAMLAVHPANEAGPVEISNPLPISKPQPTGFGVMESF